MSMLNAAVVSCDVDVLKMSTRKVNPKYVVWPARAAETIVLSQIC